MFHPGVEPVVDLVFRIPSADPGTKQNPAWKDVGGEILLINQEFKINSMQSPTGRICLHYREDIFQVNIR